MGLFFGRKILLPGVGDIAPLHDQGLAIFQGGADHLPGDGPHNGGKGFVLGGGQGNGAAADQAHFQVVQAQVGDVTAFQQLLGQQGLARMGGPGNQINHGIPPADGCKM